MASSGHCQTHTSQPSQRAFTSALPLRVIFQACFGQMETHNLQPVQRPVISRGRCLPTGDSKTLPPGIKPGFDHPAYQRCICNQKTRMAVSNRSNDPAVINKNQPILSVRSNILTMTDDWNGSRCGLVFTQIKSSNNILDHFNYRISPPSVQ